MNSVAALLTTFVILCESGEGVALGLFERAIVYLPTPHPLTNNEEYTSRLRFLRSALRHVGRRQPVVHDASGEWWLLPR